MNKKIIVIATLCMLCSITRVYTQEENTIVVEGEASVTVPVEYISISLHISSLEKKPRSVQETNEKIINEVFAMLKNDYSLKQEHYFSENTRLLPRYEYNNQALNINKRRVLVGYEASTKLIVMLYDYHKFSELILSLLNTSVQEISAISYVPSSDPKYYNTALAKALKVAEQKAKIIAETLNKTLDYGTLQITEHSTAASYPVARMALSEAAPSANMGIAETREIKARLSLQISIAE